MIEQIHEIAVRIAAQFPHVACLTQTYFFERRIDPEFPALRNVAVTALKQNRGSWEGAVDVVFKAVRNDAALMWALFEPYRAVAVQRLLTEVAQDLRANEEVTKLVQAKPTGGQNESGPYIASAPEGLSDNVRRQIEARSKVAALSLLDTFKINRKAIGDCTPKEAKEWAAKRERDARFVNLLTRNLPPDEPIRKWVKPETVQEVWTQADQETVNE